jgi:2-polyprenyl-6-methoxyphenol hydroxylase-like FAD-dependent oxidoreductase
VGDVVQRTLRSDKIPESTFKALAEEAREIWPEPWRAAILDCIARRAVIGTPVAEYLPKRLSHGRICLVGDAAHVPSPMTGRGFAASALDALALAEALDDGGLRSGTVDALQRYDAKRLRAARELVRSGQSFSHSFI